MSPVFDSIKIIEPLSALNFVIYFLRVSYAIICILLSNVRKISWPGTGFLIIPIVSMGRPILSFFTFFNPCSGNRILLLINSMPSCPLSSMFVNPIIFEKGLPPR